MTTGTVDDDHALAALLAGEAAQLLNELRVEGWYMGPAALRDEADRRSHLLLMKRLAESRPNDAVLSEEGQDGSARLASSRVWVVDPLDGTREFGEEGRVDWAVHVALVIDATVVAGAVALPGRDMILSTASPPVVPTVALGERPLRVLTSRTRMPPAADVVAEALAAELVPLGSAGAKAMAVVMGDGDVYAHSGGMYEWDSAAPVAVALSAGLHVSRIDGSPLRYNQANPWMPDILVCRPELAELCLKALRPLVEPAS